MRSTKVRTAEMREGNGAGREGSCLQEALRESRDISGVIWVGKAAIGPHLRRRAAKGLQRRGAKSKMR